MAYWHAYGKCKGIYDGNKEHWEFNSEIYSQSYTLHTISTLISEPAVSILGGPDLFINAGSFINLTCVANFLPGLPLDVDWFHEKQVRKYEVTVISIYNFCMVESVLLRSQGRS